MAYRTTKNHAGAKNQQAKAGYWGSRSDAKQASKKTARAYAHVAILDSITDDDIDTFMNSKQAQRMIELAKHGKLTM